MVTVWNYIRRPAGYRLNDAEELEDPDYNDRYQPNQLIVPLEISNACQEASEED